MENRAHALIAGLFVVVLGMAVAGALWWLGQGSVKVDRYVVETRGNVAGLNIQAQVRYRGIRAGKVEAIELDAEDPRLILITVALDKRFRITRASRAQLGYQGLTGLAYLQIDDDGSSNEALVANGAGLPRLQMSEGSFDGLIGRATQAMEQVTELTGRLQKFVDQRNIDHVARTLENLAKGSESLRELPAVVADLRRFTGPETLERWQRILAQVETAVGSAAPVAGELRQLLASLNAVAQRADRMVEGIDAVGAQAQTHTLPQLEQTLHELRATSRQLGRVLDGLEREPRMLLFGTGAAEPGPGEAGFSLPATTH